MGVPKRTIIRAAGLYSDPSDYDAPEGALAQADNIEIRRRGVIEKRRGFNAPVAGPNGGSTPVRSMTTFGSFLIAHEAAATRLWSQTVGGSQAVISSSVTEPTVDGLVSVPVEFAESQRTLFFTTNTEGIWAIESETSSGLRRAGGVQPAEMFGVAAPNTGANDWCAINSRVAYRLTIGFKDDFGRLIEGPPSGRCFGTSAASACVFDVSFPIPPGVTLNHFYRLYRTKQIASTTDDPGDDMGLVYEAFFTSTSTFSTVTVTDIATDDLIGPAPYWQLERGPMDGNAPPPRSTCLAEFKGSMLFGDTRELHRLFFTLLGVTSGTSLTSGDSLTIADDEYSLTLNAGASNDTATNTFAVYTSSTAGVNIETTARNLVEIINRENSSWRAVYLSGPEDLPGQIMLERWISRESFEEDFNFYMAGSARVTATYSPSTPQSFHINTAGLSRTGATVTGETTAAHGFATGDVVVLGSGDTGTTADANFPYGAKTLTGVPTSTTFTYTETGTATTSGEPYKVFLAKAKSSNDTNPAGLAWSKTGQPDSVPLVNRATIGNRSRRMLGIRAVRNAAFVFKEDGIYSLTGEGAPFRVDSFDPTVVLYGRRTAVPLDNRIFALTNQGVVAVSESGVEVLSGPIQKTLRDLFATSLTAVKNYSFGIGYESDRKYVLYTVSDSLDASATQAFVYHLDSGAWTRWTRAASAGVVHPSNDLLFLGDATAGIAKERKTAAAADFQDNTAAITSTVKWAPIVTPELPELKHFTEAEAFFGGTAPASVTFGFATEEETSEETVAVTTTTLGIARSDIPDGKQRAHRLSVSLTHATASEACAVQGLAVGIVASGGKATY